MYAIRSYYDAYGRDLVRYVEFLDHEGVSQVDQVTPALILRFLARLKQNGLSPRSRARALVALRVFHKFLLTEGLATNNPTTLVEAPRSARLLPHALSPLEVV